jgi:opacity protein-like surface antigen
MSRSMTTDWAAAAVLVATLATSAGAADLAAVPQCYVPVTIWTGFYVGGHAGGELGGEVRPPPRSERR